MLLFIDSDGSIKIRYIVFRKGIGHIVRGTLMKYLELSITPYTLEIVIEVAEDTGSIIVLQHNGVEVEAICTFKEALPTILESLCGKRWWAAHRHEVEQQLAQQGLSFTPLKQNGVIRTEAP